MDTSSNCPAKAQLRLHALSRLDVEATSRLQSHLEQCDLCSETFNHLRSANAETAAPEAPAAYGDSADVRDEQTPHDLIPPPVANVQAPILGHVATDFGFLESPIVPGDLGSLGVYRVLDVLGEGGMGIVFRAEDPTLQRPLALKVIRPELASHPQARARFLREAQAIAAIENDHIVAIYQVSDEAVPYLAMPLLNGQTLADRMRSDEPFAASESLRIAREIAAGLAAAHDRGVIHRDIKPANIWLEQGSDRVKLLDFGLARPTDGSSELTTTGAIAGTPLYMAPEQIESRDVDERSDLYSLGCVLYRMLTGKAPFAAPTLLAVLSAVANERGKLLHEIANDVPLPLSDLGSVKK